MMLYIMISIDAIYYDAICYDSNTISLCIHLCNYASLSE